MRTLLAAFVLVLGLHGGASAIQPDEMLPDPALEARARSIGKDLRCLVCQNQSIDDSDADLARDLRLLVRQRLVSGDSDEAARQYIVARYGDYVLLSPPFKGETVLLWVGPLLFLVAGLGAAVLFYRKRQPDISATAPLNAEEQRRLTALLGSSDGPEAS